MKDELKTKSGINFNIERNYVSYYHPTQRNEYGHVKQMTRSIKNYTEPQINALNEELTELLINFKQHTNDLENVFIAEKKFKTKAFQWVIAEEIPNVIDKINLSTLEKFAPINDYQQKYYFNEPVASVMQDIVPEVVVSSGCDAEYVVADDSNLTQLTAVINFKVLEDLQDDIVNRIVLLVNDFQDDVSKLKKMIQFYFKFEPNKQDLSTIEKKCNSIVGGYFKYYKIKKNNFVKSSQFDNYIFNFLQEDEFEFVNFLFELITKQVNVNCNLLKKVKCDKKIQFEFNAFKLQDQQKNNFVLSKLLYFKLNYNDNSKVDSHLKEEFFKHLDSLLSFGNTKKSLASYIKNIRLTGDFSNTQEHVCLICNSKNFTKVMLEPNSRFVIDCLSFDYHSLLEKTLAYGFNDKCDYIYDDAENCKDNLIAMLSQNQCLKHHKFLYLANILPEVSKQLDLEDFEYHSLNYDYTENLSKFNLSINTRFHSKIDEYFAYFAGDYISQKNITKNTIEFFTDSFIVTMHGFLLDSQFSKNFSIQDRNFLINQYNTYINENIAGIIEYLTNFSSKKLDIIFDKYLLVDDYEFKKSAVQNAILKQIELPYSYLSEICNKFTNYIWQ